MTSNPFDRSPANKDSAKERIERFIDTRLNQLLEENCQKVNEGNNGAILKLNINDVPEDLLVSLRESGIVLNTDQAVKVMKFYSGGRGLNEFQMQQQAYELVSEQSEYAQIAKIPKPHLYRDLAILPSVRERLKQMGIKKINDKVELLVMDFVPGEDLATIMFREIIRTSPKTRDLLHHLDRLGFEDLERELPRALGFAETKTVYRDEADRQSQEKRQQIKRYNTIHSELSKQGFRLHPAILLQVKNAMNLMHENGMSHRDGHHRNFMITGDPSVNAVNAPEVYIIDFGSSIRFDGNYEDQKERIYREGWGSGDPKRLTDEDILASLERLSGGGEDTVSKSMNLFEKRLSSSHKVFMAERDGKRFLQILKHMAENGETDFSSKYSICPTRPKRPFAFMSALLELKEEGVISESQLIQNIKSASYIAEKEEKIELKRALVIFQN